MASVLNCVGCVGWKSCVGLGTWVNLRGSWVLFGDNFARVILRGGNFLRGLNWVIFWCVSGTFCVGYHFVRAL